MKVFIPFKNNELVFIICLDNAIKHCWLLFIWPNFYFLPRKVLKIDSFDPTLRVLQINGSVRRAREQRFFEKNEKNESSKSFGEPFALSCRLFFCCFRVKSVVCNRTVSYFVLWTKGR